MFTGLVQGTGKIDAVDGRGSETRLRIRAGYALLDIVKGESIAVNGVCLTVETFGERFFDVYASAETLSVTNLGGLRTGSNVNLERALALGDRLGGHMVSGHVDCPARVESVSPAGESKLYRLGFPKEFGPLVVPKGSVALDGISLTVNECGDDWLTVNIIPATQRETTIQAWSAGYTANMETDIIGRYVQRMLQAYGGVGAGGKGSGGKGPSGSGASGPSGSGLDRDFLARHGF